MRVNLCRYAPKIGRNAGIPCRMPTVGRGKFCRGCERKVRYSGREKEYDQAPDGVSLPSDVGEEENHGMNFGILFPLLESVLLFFPSTLCKLVSQYTYGISISSSDITFETSLPELTSVGVSLTYRVASIVDVILDEQIEVDGDMLLCIGKKMLSHANYLSDSGSCMTRNKDRELIIFGSVPDPAPKILKIGQGDIISPHGTCYERFSIGHVTCIRCFTSDLKLKMSSKARSDILKERKKQERMEIDWDVEGQMEVDSVLYSYTLSLVQYSYTREARKVI